MFGLKIVAMLTIVISTTLIGLKISKDYRERPRQIRQLIFALQIHSSEIGYGTTLLPDIWYKLGKRLDAPVNQLYQGAYDIYHYQQCDTLTAMTQSLRDVTSNLSLAKDEIEIITFLGKQLGRSDRKEQEKYLSLAMTELSRLEVSACQEAVKYVRLWNALGFLSGLLIIIILL